MHSTNSMPVGIYCITQMFSKMTKYNQIAWIEILTGDVVGALEGDIVGSYEVLHPPDK